jgi:hypothetical protein
MEKQEQRFLIKYFWVKKGAQKIHQEFVITLRTDAYGWSQIKIWLQKFRNGDSPCKDVPRTGRPFLTLSPNLRHFFKSIILPVPEYLCSTSWLACPAIREVLQRELGLIKFYRRWVLHFLSPAQSVAHVEASVKMPQILHESAENHFEWIVTGDKSGFQYSNIPIRPQNVCTTAGRISF